MDDPEEAEVIYPKVFVWDLDGTVWDPEMYQLYGGSPFKPHGHDVRDRKGEHIRILGDAREILLSLSEREDALVAIASTCTEPEWAVECLQKMQVVEGRPLEQCFHSDLVEIYYQHSKDVHLRAIQKKSSCEIHEMIFFDNQMNNIRVAQRLGVFSVYTPDGVTHEIFQHALKSYTAFVVKRDVETAGTKKKKSKK